MMTHCKSYNATMRGEYFLYFLGRRFGTSKMHLSPPLVQAAVRSKAVDSVGVDFLFIVTPIVGVCKCSMFCCTLHYSIPVLQLS